MPVPLVSYSPQPPHMAPSPPGATPCQILCNGCRTLLIYPQGATNVRCSICGAITPIGPAAGTEMAQVICGGCHTVLLYPRGASSVHCSCCHTMNLTIDGNQIAHVNCGQCGTTLMYPFGAPSVKCALCQFVTSIGMSNTRMPMHPPQILSANMVQPMPTSQPAPLMHTVVVENPMTHDESGNLVSNVAVGVTSEK